VQPLKTRNDVAELALLASERRLHPLAIPVIDSPKGRDNPAVP
jgi:hypothetical protein